MRWLIGALAAVLLAAAPAQAHWDFTYKAFSTEATYYDGFYEVVNCGGYYGIEPGGTRYYIQRNGLYRDAPAGHSGFANMYVYGSRYWALADGYPDWHFHSFDGLDWDTGFATRTFFSPGGTELGTRRWWGGTEAQGSIHVGVKFVNRGPRMVVIYPNC